jgi:hypothetical protein
MAAFSKFNKFVADVANGLHHLGSDTLKIMLTNTAPLVTNNVKGDITEIAAGHGYTAGGLNVPIASCANGTGTSAGICFLLPSNNVVFTASGGPIGPFQYAVMYNFTAPANNLVCFWDTGVSQTITSGNTFTINLDGTNGILQIN